MVYDIPTNARTRVRVQIADGVEVQPWTIEFEFSSGDPDLVRLYSVDRDARVVLVETTEREGSLTLACSLGLHGRDWAADGQEFRRRGAPAGELDLHVSADASPTDELLFDLR